MKKAISFLMVIVILGFAACSQLASAGILQSEKPRVTKPPVSQGDLATLADGNSDFASELYHTLKDTSGNLFYSPYSISLALVMTFAGARGETERQMANAMHFSLLQDRLHPAFNSPDTELADRGESARGKDDDGFRLNIVNAIWGQKDYEFLSEYLDILAENYGAGPRILDFIAAPEPSRITINGLVSDQTEGRIEDLVPQGAIDKLTRLVLTNAIYFNAAWQYPFNEEATADGTFNLLDGAKITVPMMRQTESFGYAGGDNYQAVELPYDGQEFSMVILLPKTGQFEAFENSMDYQAVKGILVELTNQQVNLAMPEFEFESEFSLKSALAEMGMPVAFSTNADFSSMMGKRDLFIDEVIYKALVSVDEAGTEAAAATAVIMKLTAAPEEPVAVTIDRPSIFLIRDIETGAILFIGRVLNPEV